ncbi:MAG: hypothetical protein E1N59_700 [Puniceicoccaceae bacterium 5H]|nr:MAG: hypothetical protein E1N59_700 [Puniceicoccaceae bacterium 5H]
MMRYERFLSLAMRSIFDHKAAAIWTAALILVLCAPVYLTTYGYWDDYLLWFFIKYDWSPTTKRGTRCRMTSG